MRLRICSRAELRSVDASAWSHVISIVDPEESADNLRLPTIAVDAHLCLCFRDRKSPDRRGAPHEDSIRPLFDWLSPRQTSMTGLLVHCGAGMSRSPAIALLVLAFLDPTHDPFDQMVRVESCATCLNIWPNSLVIEIGDNVLGRNGAIIEGVDRWRDTKDGETAE